MATIQDAFDLLADKLLLPRWEGEGYMPLDHPIPTAAIRMQDYYGGEIPFHNFHLIEIDHKCPISKYGSFEVSNLAVTSRYFNQIKGDLTEEDFNILLDATYDMADGQSVIKRLLSSGRIYARSRK